MLGEKGYIPPDAYPDQLPGESATAVLDRPERKGDRITEKEWTPEDEALLASAGISPEAIRQVARVVDLDPRDPNFQTQVARAAEEAQAMRSRAEAGAITREAAGAESESRKSKALNLAGTVAKKGGEAVFRIAVAKLEMLYDTVGAVGSHFRNKDVLRRLEPLFSRELEQAAAGVEQLLKMVEQQIVLRGADGQRSFTEILRAAAADPEKIMAVRQILLSTLLSSAETRIAQGAHHVGRHVLGGGETMSQEALQARAKIEDFYRQYGVDYRNPVACQNFDSSPEGRAVAKELAVLRRALETKLRTQGLAVDFTDAEDVSARQMLRLGAQEFKRGAVWEMIRNPKEIARLVGAGMSWDHLTGLRKLNLGELINGQAFQEEVLRQLHVYETVKGLPPEEQAKLPPALQQQIDRMGRGENTPTRNDFTWKTSMWSYVPRQAKTMAYLGFRSLTWWAGLAMDQCKFLRRELKEKGREKDIKKSGVLEAVASLFEGKMDEGQLRQLQQETGLNMLTLQQGGLDAICDRMLEAVDRPGERVSDRQREVVARSFHGLEKFITRSDLSEKDRAALLLRLKERREEQQIAGLDLKEVSERLGLKIDTSSKSGLIGKVTGFFDKFRGAGLLLKDWKRVLPRNLAYLTDRVLFLGLGDFRGTLAVEGAVNMAIGGATMHALSEIPGAGDYLAAAYGGVSAAAEMASHALSGSTYVSQLRGAAIGTMERVGGEKAADQTRAILDRAGFRDYERVRQEATARVEDPTAQLAEKDQRILRQSMVDNLRDYLPTGINHLIDRFHTFREGVRLSNAQVEQIQHRFSEIVNGLTLTTTCQAAGLGEMKAPIPRAKGETSRSGTVSGDALREPAAGRVETRGEEAPPRPAGKAVSERIFTASRSDTVWSALRQALGPRARTGDVTAALEWADYYGDNRVRQFLDRHRGAVKVEIHPAADGLRFDITHDGQSLSFEGRGSVGKDGTITVAKPAKGTERQTQFAKEQRQIFSRSATVDHGETVWGVLGEMLGKGSQARDVAALLEWANYNRDAEVQRFLDRHQGIVEIDVQSTTNGLRFTIAHDGGNLIFEAPASISREGTVKVAKPAAGAARVSTFFSEAQVGKLSKLDSMSERAPERSNQETVTVPDSIKPAAQPAPERLLLAEYSPERIRQETPTRGVHNVAPDVYSFYARQNLNPARFFDQTKVIAIDFREDSKPVRSARWDIAKKGYLDQQTGRLVDFTEGHLYTVRTKPEPDYLIQEQSRWTAHLVDFRTALEKPRAMERLSPTALRRMFPEWRVILDFYQDRNQAYEIESPENYQREQAFRREYERLWTTYFESKADIATKAALGERAWILNKGVGQFQLESYVPGDHEAYDIFANDGERLFAYEGGVVVASGNDWHEDSNGLWVDGTGMGNYAGNAVIIFNPRLGSYTYYSHLRETAVAPGDIVQAGQPIGRLGHTGHRANLKVQEALRRGGRGVPYHVHFAYKREDGRTHMLRGQTLVSVSGDQPVEIGRVVGPVLRKIETTKLVQETEDQRLQDTQKLARQQSELAKITVTRAEPAPVRERPTERVLDPERAAAVATRLIPDYVRESVPRDARERTPARTDWAQMIVQEMTTSGIPATPENIALVSAVIDRESSFRLEPSVDRANFMGKVAAKIDRKIEENRGLIVTALMSLEAAGAAGDRAKEVGAGAVNVALGAADWAGRTTGLGGVEARMRADTNPQSTRERAMARLDSDKAQVTRLSKEFVRDAMARLGLDLNNMTERQLAEALRRPDAATIVMRVYDESRLSREYGTIIGAMSRASGRSFQDLIIEEMRGAVSTIGPMQLDIDRALTIARRETGQKLETAEDRLKLEAELYQLRGGLHYGITNLAPIFEAYRDLPLQERVACILADENAGMFSSRNAQIQTYCNDLARSIGLEAIAVDGDMLRYPARGVVTPSPEASKTQKLVVELNQRFHWGLSEEEIRTDLEKEKTLAFTETRTCQLIRQQVGRSQPVGWQPQLATVPDITITIGYQEDGTPRKMNVKTHVAKATAEMMERSRTLRT